MTYAKISVDVVGDVSTIRLNDPARLNAMTVGMVEDIDRALDEVVVQSRCMILTGAGRAFCAGANLAQDVPAGDDGLPDAGLTLQTHVNPLMTKLRNLSIPWISAVRGAAAGVGCSLALAADLVVASEDAYFLQAFSRIGLVPDGGSTWLLARAAGRVRAMEMMLLGDRLPASLAMEWGLVNRVTPEAQLDSTASELATRLASGPTRSLAMIRAAGWAAADMDWEEALHNERQLQQLAGHTADHKEGVAAFLAKRPARFTGA